MGGGDLNLKKSWHPQTLQNIEKVWKAEQKAEAETKKIEQLRRELDEERAREEMQRYAVDQGIAKKKSDRLEWMYSAPGHAGINREDYLLGKSIDKAVDPLATNDEKNADAPGASFMDEDSQSATNDLAAKIRDDPLFMIKKKENEKKKELLKNPVRMKQLQQMLKADLGKKGRKKKKDKKKKKEKRRKHSSDDQRKEKHWSNSMNKRKSESSEDDDEHINGTLGLRDKRQEQSYRKSEHNGDMRNSSEYKHIGHKENRKRRTYSGSPERDLRSDSISSKRTRENTNSFERMNNKHRQSESPKRRSPRRSPLPRKRGREDPTFKEYSKERRNRTPELEESRRYHDNKQDKHWRSESPKRRSPRRSLSPRKRGREDPTFGNHNSKERRNRTPEIEESRRYHDNKQDQYRRSESPKRRSPRRSPSPRKRGREIHSKERRDRTSEIEESRRRNHDKQQRTRSRSPSPGKQTFRETYGSNSRSSAAKKSEPTASRKLTDEEREKRLAEMMGNAKWRDEQRGKNVKRYKAEDEAEAKQIAQNTEKGANFVQPMKVQTFTSSTATVENRIKRNINSLQRTPAAMEKFLRK